MNLIYNKTITYTISEFYDLLNKPYSDSLQIQILDKTSTGRIKTVKINDKEMSANYICSKLSLNSTYFEIIKEDTKIIIKNKGYGHGVGMSQYGAEGMARAGYTYDEILKHYYQNIEIKKF